MMNEVATSIEDLIGNTPVLELKLRASKARLFLKLERYNPGLSMKDRMALNMVNNAEQQGLKNGGVIIESSSGNTAIGLAMISAWRGYRFIAVVDHHSSIEKVNTIKAYGGEIYYVAENCPDNKVAVVARERKAAELSRKIPNSVFMNQADNLANSAGYVNTLAKELLEQVKPIHVLFGSIGTGGSLSGTAEGIKNQSPDTKVIAVEPRGSILFGGQPSPYYQSGTGNPEGAEIPKNVRYDLIDANLFAEDNEAFTTCKFIAQKLGLLVGGSGGGVIYKALEYATDAKESTENIVVIVPDAGEKYLSNVYNDEWLAERHLISKRIYDELERKVSHK